MFISGRVTITYLFGSRLFCPEWYNFFLDKNKYFGDKRLQLNSGKMYLSGGRLGGYPQTSNFISDHTFYPKNSAVVRKIIQIIVAYLFSSRKFKKKTLRLSSISSPKLQLELLLDYLCTFFSLNRIFMNHGYYLKKKHFVRRSTVKALHFRCQTTDS